MSAPTAHRVLITGGARSGKSELAEQHLADYPEVLYVAPGPRPDATDTEWGERVRRHRERRPASWRTTETDDLVSILSGSQPEESAVLIDCLGTWLASTMDAAGCWTATGDKRRAAEQVLNERTSALVSAWRATACHIIAVTNEVGSGVVPESESVRWYRDELGRLNRQIAAVSDEVWLVTVGIGQRLK